MPSTTPKVCLVWFGSYYPGQGYTPLYELSQLLAARGWETHVITCRRRTEPVEERAQGVQVHRVDPGPWDMARLVNPAFFAAAARIIRRERFDLVHVYNVMGASLLPRLAHTRGRNGRQTAWVLDIQAGPFLWPFASLRRAMAALTRAESRCFDAVLVINEAVAEYIFGGEWARDVAGFSRLGVRLERFAQPQLQQQRELLRRQLGLAPQHLVFVHSGVLEKRRRPEDLVLATARAVAQERDLRLLFVGTGPRQRYLQYLVQRLGLGQVVIFAGLVDYPDVPRYLACADAGLSYIPSTPPGHNLQPFLKTAEYLASGLPVVCTDTPGHRCWIQDGYNGLLCADGPDSLAQAMARLARTPALREQLRQGALASARNLDWEIVLQTEILPVYQALLDVWDRNWLAKGGPYGATCATDRETGRRELYPGPEPLYQDGRRHPRSRG